VFAAILGTLVLLFTGTSWWFLSSKQYIPKSMEAGYRMVTSQFRMFTHRELREATGKFKRLEEGALELFTEGYLISE